MKKRILKILALVVALVLIIGVCIFANALVGNPVSKSLATNTAKNHLKNEYSHNDFEIERVTYSFKDGYYHAFITSPSSMDSSFTLIMTMWGDLQADTYEDRVLSGWNTADRISREYRTAVDTVLENPSFRYNAHISFGDLEFYPLEHVQEYSVPSYALITEDLTLDGVYDVNQLGADHGKLTIYIDDDTVSVEKLSEILLYIKDTFDQAGIKFFVIDCVLEYNKTEDGPKREERVEVMDFLYADIYEEGLEERIIASNKAAEAYYSSQDKEKPIVEK